MQPQLTDRRPAPGRPVGQAGEYTSLAPFPPAPPPFGLSGPPATPPRPRGGGRALLAATLALVVAVAVVAVVFVHRRSAAVPPPPPVAVPVASAAQTRLDEQLRTDTAAVEALADRWVPELFAVRIGTAPGDAVSAEAVLRSYEAARAAHPRALLLSSSAFRSFELTGYYVVVMPMPFAGSAEAIAWCAAQDLGRQECFAKRLSHTAGPAGSTVYQD